MHLEKRTNVNEMKEQEYRSLKSRLSYSNLKTYATNRTKFYKECVLGEISPKDETVSTIVGNLVHTLLSGEDFDGKFHIACATEPTGQMLELVEALFKRTLKSINAEGVQTENFEILFIDAVNAVKYDFDLKEVKFKGKSVEKIVEMFSGSDAELFYKEKLSCIGKTLVTVNQIQTAEKVVEMLKTHPYTRDIINLRTEGEIEVFNEQVVLYELEGIELRSMLDKIVINHDTKIIHSYDYKITWQNEEGFEYNYLKNSYYLQASLYHEAVKAFIIEHSLTDYQIEPMTYIAADVTANSAPVIYQLTDGDIQAGLLGFQVRDKQYMGVNQILENISWHLLTGTWNTTKAIQQSNGIITQYSLHKLIDSAYLVL